MLRLKQSILNEPEYWLTVLCAAPQALMWGFFMSNPLDACGQCGIASGRIGEHSENSQVARHGGDSGVQCKV